MKRIIVVSACGLALFQGVAAYAGIERAGTTAANFLTVGSGVGVLGMGGASLGVIGGLDAATGNAGSLGWIGETEFRLVHAQLGDALAQETFAGGGRLTPHGPRWSFTGLYQGEGGFAGRNTANQSTGSFDVASMAFGGRIAQTIGGVVSIGAGAKWVNENLEVMRGSGLTFDAGASARLGSLGLGFAAENVGGVMTYGTEQWGFPTNLGLGLCYDHEKTGLRVALDVNMPNAYYTNVRTGIEWRWQDHLALRTGYRLDLSSPSDDPLNGPTFGLGAGSHSFWLDYAYVVQGDGGVGQHRMGLSLRPGHLGFVGDPFGQKDMPREFGDPGLVGPPAPETGKKKS
jgi:hypothetical protein